ncbi:MAG: type II secretion system protein, partial [Patescibacteria group bacterium]
MRRREGFTLLELIVYVGILAVSAALLTGILSTTLKVQNRESASNEVTSQLNFVMQNINRLVRESSNIEIATSTATSTLKLRMKDSAKDPTCLSLVNGVIKLAEGPGSNPNNCTDVTSNLTNNRVIADNLEFTKFSQYPGHDTVSVDIQLMYNSQNPQQRLTRELRSAIARVSAATFDSNLLPGSTNYTIGQQGSPWLDAFISNLLYLGRLSSDPSASQEGAIYYNTASSTFRGYKPSGWANLGESLWTASG